MRFLNRKYGRKALLNRRRLDKLNKEKHDISQNTKIFNENLTLMNENIDFNGRKLKGNGVVHAWFTTDGIARIKNQKIVSP